MEQEGGIGFEWNQDSDPILFYLATGISKKELELVDSN